VLTNNKNKLFFSGIAGSGMSSLALFSTGLGHFVYGSDRLLDINASHPIKDVFDASGIIVTPQDGSGLGKHIDLAIFSTAVEETNLDFIKANSLNIPIMKRPEYLACLVKEFNTIAIAGTSGKSTTSGMLAFLMRGLSLKPNFIGGGRVKQFINKLNQGNFLKDSSDLLIIEACESDGSIVNYYPKSTILLNLTLDHHTVEETGKLFERLIDNTSNKIIINADDDNLKALNIKDAITFSINKPSDYKPSYFHCGLLNSHFILKDTEFTLSIPGKYNLLNALACIAYLSEIGISMNDIVPILSTFQGIERRFDIHLNSSKGFVIDDYAHNPHKISSLMETTSKVRDSTCYIFQPHGYGPTRLMRDGYIEVFTKYLRNSDHLILLPIYYMGGSAVKDISSEDIVNKVKSKGKSAEVIHLREEVLKKCDDFKAFVVFGARDDSLSDLARMIAHRLSND